jgi:hypothetical protein
MTMRDLQRLEELSSTAALGLWADDVVLALDRASSLDGVSDADRQLLDTAARVLEETLERTSQPLSTPKSARALAATDTTLTAVAVLAQEQAGNEQELLAQMVQIIREASEGELTANDAERLRPVIALFGLVSELQLVESNSVLTSRKDTRTWTATQTISSFS